MTRGIAISTKPYSNIVLAVAMCLWPALAQALDASDTATGTGALASETSGFNNTADGYFALHGNTSGSYNTAVGAHALETNSGGFSNTATGVFALDANTTGSGNVASGVSSLANNTTGGHNVAIGFNALQVNTTGQNNVALGDHTLYNIGAGQNNVAVGYGALIALTSGNSNIALGVNAGSRTTTGTGNIVIGSNGAVNESHVTRIGTAQTKTFIAGISGTHLSGASVVINSLGQLGVVASSARYKQGIQTLGDASEKLAQLRPVSYQYKTEPGVTHFGLIAEEVDKVIPELVVRDEQNRPESVQYQEIVPLLLQQWKAQQTENARERAMVAQQNETIAQQRQLIERQETEIAELRRLVEKRLAAVGASRVAAK